ncbi:MAG: aminotransferase class I/II-fold pyridoxal phosphate-dependent enzyme [Acidimicrobiia bacterium]
MSKASGSGDGVPAPPPAVALPVSAVAEAFTPPPYPYARLNDLRRLADTVPGGLVDLSVGTPCDPVPEVAARALAEAGPRAAGYPPAAGTPAFLAAACGWMRRTFGVEVEPSAVLPCIGTKELVSSLPHLLRLRTPSKDTVLYPAVSYPTYAMGAQLAGCRAVPVPLDADWHIDLSGVSPSDAERALVLWMNEPANPTGAAASPERFEETVAWGQTHAVLVASDECYAEFTYDTLGRSAAPHTALAASREGVLALHSLSKRSNLAGLRAGFAAGDPELVAYLRSVRTHAGMMLPGPVQAAAAAALDDDAHVIVQREIYARRRALVGDWAAASDRVVSDGGPASFYLWLRDSRAEPSGWRLASEMAEAGTVVSPGELYGERGSGHVRVALVAPIERLSVAVERLAARLG